MTAISNPFEIADAFANETRDVKDARKAKNALTQIQAHETVKALQNRNVLQDLAKKGGKFNDIINEYTRLTGDIQTAQALQTNQLASMKAEAERHKAGLEYVMKSAKLVNKENYKPWVQSMIRQGYAQEGQLPAEYDADLMESYQQTAKKQWYQVTKRLGDNKAKQVMLDPRGNVLEEGPEYEYNKPAQDAVWKQKADATYESLVGQGVPDAHAKFIAEGLALETIKENDRMGPDEAPLVDLDGNPVWLTPREEEEPPEERNRLWEGIKSAWEQMTAPPKGTKNNPFKPKESDDPKTIPPGAWMVHPKTGKTMQMPRQ